MNKKSTILIVDDVELNRAFLNDMLEDEYEILEASNGQEALDMLDVYGERIHVVLLDVVMPVMDGFEVLFVMNKEGWIQNIPVIMISAETSSDYTNRGFEMGVSDYISRPFDSGIIRHRIKNTIMLYAKQRSLLELVKDQIREKEKNNSLMVDILSTIVEFRNGESGLHVLRIRIITEILLEALQEHSSEYKLSASDISVISNAAALHDIGKVAIPEYILNKPEKLTKEEYEVMKTHSAYGAAMLRRMNYRKQESLLTYAYDICRWHHERWDGKGYPDGLSGNEIPICAQVVSLADVYDALISERVYKPPYTHEEAMQMILNGECGQFNPQLIECLLAKGDEIYRRIMQKSGPEEERAHLDSVSKEVLEQKEISGISDRTLMLLEKERMKYQFLASLSNEILFEYDTKTDELTFSELGYQEFGLDLVRSDASTQITWEPILSKADCRDLWKNIFKTTREDPIFRKSYLVRTPDGKELWYEFITRSLWTDSLKPVCIGFVGKMSNIHYQAEEAKQLRNMAERDSLTHLYNQAAARKLVSASLKENRGHVSAILFFDLDHFKLVNDTRGHAFGDELLKYVAKTLMSNIRRYDIAARLGGDEFMVFLCDIGSRKNAENKTAQLQKALSGAFQGYNFSTSIGAVICGNECCDYDTFLHQADIALYKAKRGGKNRYVFYEPEDEDCSIPPGELKIGYLSDHSEREEE